MEVGGKTTGVSGICGVLGSGVIVASGVHVGGKELVGNVGGVHVACAVIVGIRVSVGRAVGVSGNFTVAVGCAVHVAFAVASGADVSVGMLVAVAPKTGGATVLYGVLKTGGVYGGSVICKHPQCSYGQPHPPPGVSINPRVMFPISESTRGRPTPKIASKLNATTASRRLTVFITCKSFAVAAPANKTRLR